MICSSFSWPNMFDVARGRINLYNDTRSVTNRVKLLLLTDPTELHMNPKFGVGLKKYIFRYNNDNVVALIKDNLIEQLRMYEPSVIPEDTTVERKALTDSNEQFLNHSVADSNNLRLTVTLQTVHSGRVSFNVDQTIPDQDFI